jgi:hypothetical protein
MSEPMCARYCRTNRSMKRFHKPRTLDQATDETRPDAGSPARPVLARWGDKARLMLSTEATELYMRPLQGHLFHELAPALLISGIAKDRVA